MMNLTELKKMLQKDFNVKYLSDLEQIELIQNNEDLHIGVVKVELKVAYKYYTIGTFGVLNKNAKVDGRKIKASMTYLNKIATWLVEKQEVDVRIFIDDDYQTTKKVKQVELLTTQEPTQAIEKVACEVEPTIKEETQEQPTFKEKREYKKTHMELIYNIVTNNVKGFNEEYKNRAITRLYKYTDDMYTARFTLSYFYHDEKEKWMFTLKNHDGILLNYNIHKSLLNEKWLLDLCKDINDIINESK